MSKLNVHVRRLMPRLLTALLGEKSCYIIAGVLLVIYTKARRYIHRASVASAPQSLHNERNYWRIADNLPGQNYWQNQKVCCGAEVVWMIRRSSLFEIARLPIWSWAVKGPSFDICSRLFSVDCCFWSHFPRRLNAKTRHKLRFTDMLLRVEL